MSSIDQSKALRYAAGAVVVVTVMWAFYLVGSPGFNRKLSADLNRTRDLQALHDDVERYFEQEKGLPKNLQDLEKLRYWRRFNLEDPGTQQPYEYRVAGQFSYELCATFELPSKDADLERSPYYGRDGKFWAHDVGHRCFQFEISAGKRTGSGHGNLPEAAR